MKRKEKKGAGVDQTPRELRERKSLVKSFIASITQTAGRERGGCSVMGLEEKKEKKGVALDLFRAERRDWGAERGKGKKKKRDQAQRPSVLATKRKRPCRVREWEKRGGGGLQGFFPKAAKKESKDNVLTRRVGRKRKRSALSIFSMISGEGKSSS